MGKLCPSAIGRATLVRVLEGVLGCWWTALPKACTEHIVEACHAPRGGYGWITSTSISATGPTSRPPWRRLCGRCPDIQQGKILYWGTSNRCGGNHGCTDCRTASPRGHRRRNTTCSSAEVEVEYQTCTGRSARHRASAMARPLTGKYNAGALPMPASNGTNSAGWPRSCFGEPEKVRSATSPATWAPPPNCPSVVPEESRCPLSFSAPQPHQLEENLGAPGVVPVLTDKVMARIEDIWTMPPLTGILTLMRIDILCCPDRLGRSKHRRPGAKSRVVEVEFTTAKVDDRQARQNLNPLWWRCGHGRRPAHCRCHCRTTIPAGLRPISTCSRWRTPRPAAGEPAQAVGQPAPALWSLQGHRQRIRDEVITLELSIGDYVLSGELAAAVLADALVRLVPAPLEMGRVPSRTVSRTDCSLRCIYRGRQIGTDKYRRSCWVASAEIDQWRMEQAMERTKRLRPDLLDEA